MLICQGARVRKGPGWDEGFFRGRREGIEDVRGAETVAYAGVFGGWGAVNGGDGFGPFQDRGEGEGGVFFSPLGVVESWIGGGVVFVFAVFPDWILWILSVIRRLGMFEDMVWNWDWGWGGDETYISKVIDPKHSVPSIGETVHQ